MLNIPPSPLQDGPAVTDADLAALLAGKRDVAPWLLPVADVLGALRTEPSPGELAGEARALAEFRRRAGTPVARHRARRAARRTSRLSTKAAAGAAAGAVLLGGAATAAFAGVLPAPIQQFAHDIIGAPGAPPASQPGPASGKPTVPTPFASPAKHAASAKPHSTGRHPNRHADGQPGTGQSQGQQGGGQGQQGGGQGQQGGGQGQHGNGQGSSHGKGQGGSPHDRGQPGDGQGQGNPHAHGRHANPHSLGQQGNPHPNPKPTARHARPARHGPAMEP
jgi:hypothetical protein